MYDRDTEIVCTQCKNYGYYEFGVVKGESSAMTFCTCVVGQGLKKMSIEWRLGDIKTIANNIVPKLQEIKVVKDIEEGSKIADGLIKDMEELVKRTEEGLDV